MWDSAIDDAARAMTSGEPGAELRARVLARSDERPRTTRLVWMAIVPLVIVALLVMVQRVQRVQKVPSVQDVQRVQVPERQSQITNAATRSVTSGIQPRARRPAAQPPEEKEEAVVPELEPLRLEPVDVEAVPQPDDIVVDSVPELQPIEIDQIEIPALAQ